MIIETFRQAIQNVWSNKLRTFLTMLGIIMATSRFIGQDRLKTALIYTTKSLLTFHLS